MCVCLRVYAEIISTITQKQDPHHIHKMMMDSIKLKLHKLRQIRWKTVCNHHIYIKGLVCSYARTLKRRTKNERTILKKIYNGKYFKDSSLKCLWIAKWAPEQVFKNPWSLEMAALNTSYNYTY